MSHARCTTQSAPSSTGPRSSREMSAVAHVVLAGGGLDGRRRATATISVTASSSLRARSTAVPTLPVPPITTTRMGSGLPA